MATLTVPSVQVFVQIPAMNINKGVCPLMRKKESLVQNQSVPTQKLVAGVGLFFHHL